MAVVDRERLRDSTGAVHLYRPVPDTEDPVTGHREPPEQPHPDAILHARWSGWGIPPDETRSLEDVLAYYAAHPGSEGHPFSGDETVRFRRWRSPEHYWPRFRDIAHVLYPGGRLPVPVGDEPADDQHPDQLTIFDALEAMQK